MLIQKLQLPKIPDSLEAALEYLGAERWVCWYWDDEETLLLEDINSYYFGNSKAWLLFCSHIDANKKIEQGELSRKWALKFHSINEGTEIYLDNFRSDLKDIFNLA